MEHCSAVARLIREDMEVLDQLAGIASQSDDTPDDIEDFKKFSIGSIQPSCTLDALCHEHCNDTAFGGFRTRLNRFLTSVLGQTLSLRGIDQVSATASSMVLALIDLIFSCKSTGISKSTTSRELTGELPKITFDATRNSTTGLVTTSSFTSRLMN